MSLKKAAFINAISKYSTVFVNLIFNAILARILSPSDFGAVAVVTVFTTFFSIFSDAGIGSAVVQEKTLNSNEIEDIFSCTIYFGVILGVLFCIFSFFIASFYNDRIYVRLGMILSISIMFSSLNIVPNAILMRNKKFIFVGIRNVTASLVNFIVAIILACLNFKAFSIVWGSVSYSVLLFIMNYFDSRIKFRLKPDIRSMKKIWGFSVYQLGFTIVNYFSRNLDNLLAGKLLGSDALGYYDKSYKLMLYPVNNLVNVITPVLHPVLSDYKDNKEYIYNKYVSLVKILSSIGMMCSVICFFCAEEIVLILYGKSWIQSIPSFKILSITVAFQMVSSSAGAIYQSISDTKTMFVSGLSYMVVTVGCILVGIMFGSIETLAFGVMIALVVKFFIEFFYLIKKAFGYNVLQFYRQILPDAYIGSIVVVVLILNEYITKCFGSVLLTLAEKIVVGFATYAILLVATKRIKIFYIILGRRCRE